MNSNIPLPALMGVANFRAFEFWAGERVNLANRYPVLANGIPNEWDDAERAAMALPPAVVARWFRAADEIEAIAQSVDDLAVGWDHPELTGAVLRDRAHDIFVGRYQRAWKV